MFYIVSLSINMQINAKFIINLIKFYTYADYEQIKRTIGFVFMLWPTKNI